MDIKIEIDESGFKFSLASFLEILNLDNCEIEPYGHLKSSEHGLQ